MPLQKLKQTGGGAILLWHITESEAELSAMTVGDACPSGITHLRRRKEWLAGRLLAKELARYAGLHYRGIGIHSSGKPYLKGHTHWMSLSHSFPYAVAQVSNSHPVGVDVERPCSLLCKVSSKVLDPDELDHAGDNMVKLCVYWCAKEALYKVYGSPGVSFAQHLRITPFHLSGEGNLIGSLEREGVRKSAYFYYKVYARFVLVYSRST